MTENALHIQLAKRRAAMPQQAPLYGNRHAERNATMWRAYRDGRTLESIGKEWGISRMRVSQIIGKMAQRAGLNWNDLGGYSHV